MAAAMAVAAAAMAAVRIRAMAAARTAVAVIAAVGAAVAVAVVRRRTWMTKSRSERTRPVTLEPQTSARRHHGARFASGLSALRRIGRGHHGTGHPNGSAQHRHHRPR